MKTLLITGGNKGIGRMISKVMAESGWSVAIAARSYDQGVFYANELSDQTGQKVCFYQADVTSRQEIRSLVQEVKKDFGGVHALVHAVGPFLRERKLFTDHSAEEIEELIQGNFMSSLWLTHEMIPMMREELFGRLIYFGFGRVSEAPAWPDRSVYAAAKTGLVSFMKSIAVEEAVYGITANMVSPGDIIGEYKEMTREQVTNIFDEETPRGRPGSGEDVARIVHFLLQEPSDFITGSVLNATGGLDVIHPRSKKQITSIQ
ncbi:SDR family oxidoreductase [Thermoactinomyces sp. DSM 45892]|uniref:SDR family oxidoreductase n=1 Tax=Thermoactinomyces sp. DSM 45892 TaxID=1882753 RepID=UPI00089D1F70|nr:SDR family oxidoreductase [Thermoactinomyces sp. DSM 45892]SDZ37064.1 3-oxoacyl-[acyl-carrier protein] reductase [Thermoactinomyces sp. DSM 45892]